jgi:hypothetical protein
VTVKHNHFQALPRAMATSADVREAVGVLENETCAEFSRTDQRAWVRLVGRRIDIQRWTPDARVASIPSTHRCARLLDAHGPGVAHDHSAEQRHSVLVAT